MLIFVNTHGGGGFPPVGFDLSAGCSLCFHRDGSQVRFRTSCVGQAGGAFLILVLGTGCSIGVCCSGSCISSTTLCARLARDTSVTFVPNAGRIFWHPSREPSCLLHGALCRLGWGPLILAPCVSWDRVNDDNRSTHPTLWIIVSSNTHLMFLFLCVINYHHITGDPHACYFPWSYWHVCPRKSGSNSCSPLAHKSSHTPLQPHECNICILQWFAYLVSYATLQTDILNASALSILKKLFGKKRGPLLRGGGRRVR